MKNLKMFSFLMVLLTVAALAGGCKGGKGKGEGRMNWMVEKVTDKLELDKDQENKLRDLAKTIAHVKKSQREKRKADKETLKNMILSEKLDKEAGRKLFDSHQEAHRQAFDPVFEKLQAFHASLTKEQKQEAVKYLEKFEKRFR